MPGSSTFRLVVGQAAESSGGGRDAVPEASCKVDPGTDVLVATEKPETLAGVGKKQAVELEIFCYLSFSFFSPPQPQKQPP